MAVNGMGEMMGEDREEVEAERPLFTFHGEPDKWGDTAYNDQAEVFKDGSIAVEVGGVVFRKPISAWFKLATKEFEEPTKENEMMKYNVTLHRWGRCSGFFQGEIEANSQEEAEALACDEMSIDHEWEDGEETISEVEPTKEKQNEN